MSVHPSPRSARCIGALFAAVIGLAGGPAPAEVKLHARTLHGTRAEAATLIIQGIEGGSIPFAATPLTEEAQWVDNPDGERKLRLPITFEIPTTAEGSVELYAYAITADGGVAAHLGLGLALPATGAGARVVAALDLPPATYSMRFLVLDPESHRFGLLRRKTALTPPGEPAAALGPPRLEDGCASWAIAATVRGVSTTITARPVLVRGSRVELSTVGPAASAGEPPPRIRVVMEPTSAEESETQTIEAQLVEALTEPGATRLELAFDLPSIGRGVYQLSVELTRNGAELASPPIEAWVVDTAELGEPAAHPCARTWGSVIAAASRSADAPNDLALGTPAPESEANSRARAGRRFERDKLRSAYREVLDLLATGADLATAALELCRVEQRYAAELSNLPALMRTELDVVRRLAARETEVLPPLMLLHHQAYLQHRQHELYPLAGHSARVARAIGELLIDRNEHPESRMLASHILTSLAEYGHRNRSFIPSQSLLEAALAIAPDNPEALQLLAVNYEWFGRYDEAANLLERLVDLDASDREARLRLGVLRQRTGEAARAEQHLRRILAEGAPPWILSLAYQTLSHLLNERGRFEETIALLDAARTRVPGDQTLYLLSAHALERAGRFSAARQLLAELPVDGSIGSPRLRYGESLTAPLEALRDDIERAAAVRMPLLGRAIESASIGSGAR